MMDWKIDIDQQKLYNNACLEAFNDNAAFANFKRNPYLNMIWEHVDEHKGMEYYNAILNKVEPDIFDDYLRDALVSDDVGYPRVYKYPTPLNPDDTELMSPTTLRYLYVFIDICCKDILQNNVVEIGGGYGGQSLVIILCNSFMKQYIIIDTPSASLLQQKYLNQYLPLDLEHCSRYCLNTDNFYLADYSKQEDFLVISNYALDELSSTAIMNYMKRIIRHAKNGYLTVNNHKDMIFKMVSEYHKPKREPEPKGVGNAEIIWW